MSMLRSIMSITPQAPDAGAASHEEAAAASIPSTNVATENVAASDNRRGREVRPEEPVPKKKIIIKNVVIANPTTGTVSETKTITLSGGIIVDIKDAEPSSPHDMSVHVVDRLVYPGFALLVMRALLWY
ncbi:hypothetical protein E4U42_003616 [Claviceps africana]|uniref:Uncharacterized protein n=1 Tax=Claviceps africana TaxID=83212 RepID=A0A8K0NKT4_9HYPO|nr:hypothetical protein E4U42_003616 [Claviceps africana]